MELMPAGDIYLSNKVLATLANFYLLNGDFDKTERVIQLILKISRSLDDNFGALIGYQFYYQLYILKDKQEKREKLKSKIIKFIESNNYSLDYFYLLEARYWLFKQEYKRSLENLNKITFSYSSIYSNEWYIMARVYFIINAFFLKDFSIMEKYTSKLKEVFTDIQDVFLVGFIYLWLFYDELAKGNEDYARILFRKAEGNIVQFYGGLEMLRVYYDLLEEDIFPSNREEFVSSSLRILKKCSFEHILYSRSLKLDII
jgi:tetratricopeptide (TPR) repeat protein